LQFSLGKVHETSLFLYERRRVSAHGGCDGKFILEGQKAYIAINGTGGAALLAFLQAIGVKADARSLTIGAFWGVVFFAIGVALGAATCPVRHLALAREEYTSAGSIYRLAHWYLQVAPSSVFCWAWFAPRFGGFKALRYMFE
jgi:hypothetical protein